MIVSVVSLLDLCPGMSTPGEIPVTVVCVCVCVSITMLTYTELSMITTNCMYSKHVPVNFICIHLQHCHTLSSSRAIFVRCVLSWPGFAMWYAAC